MINFQAEMPLEPFTAVLALKLISQWKITNESHLQSDPIEKMKQFRLSNGISIVVIALLNSQSTFEI